SRGVQQAQDAGGLLHAAFGVRTLALFDRLPADALASYLSGLVIGEELRERGPLPASVMLVGSAVLCARYRLALQLLGCTARSLGSGASWRGLWALAQTLEDA